MSIKFVSQGKDTVTHLDPVELTAETVDKVISYMDVNRHGYDVPQQLHFFLSQQKTEGVKMNKEE